jgi:IS5 family transposase
MTDGLPRVARSTTADRLALASFNWILRMVRSHDDYSSHIRDFDVTRQEKWIEQSLDYIP